MRESALRSPALLGKSRNGHPGQVIDVNEISVSNSRLKIRVSSVRFTPWPPFRSSSYASSITSIALVGAHLVPKLINWPLADRKIAALLVTALAITTPLFAESGTYRTVFGPVPAAPGKMRVLLYYDLEGLSGLSDWHAYLFRYKELYADTQKLVAGDVNAVIDGLFAGGATQVDVVDCHSSGNPEPDLPLDQLDPRAKHVFRDTPFESFSGLTESGAYEAIVVVGMHGKTGTVGFAAHTYGVGKDFILNGQSMSETDLIAYSWGRVGVPVILVTGDDTTKADLKETPWIESVVVKTSLGPNSVKLRPIEQVHPEMRATAKRALMRRA